MSKSRGNVETPDAYVEKYGADTLRLFMMFMGPWVDGADWDASGIEGVHRFLRRGLGVGPGGAPPARPGGGGGGPAPPPPIAQGAERPPAHPLHTRGAPHYERAHTLPRTLR